MSVADRAVRFRPADAVVVYAAMGAAGRSVDTCCSTINFFTSGGRAQLWITAHPAHATTVLSQDQTVALGRKVFEPLLG